MLLSHNCLLTSHVLSVQKPLGTAGKEMRGLQDPLAYAIPLEVAGDSTVELPCACRMHNGQINKRG